MDEFSENEKAILESFCSAVKYHHAQMPENERRMEDVAKKGIGMLKEFCGDVAYKLAAEETTHDFLEKAKRFAAR